MRNDDVEKQEELKDGLRRCLPSAGGVYLIFAVSIVLLGNTKVFVSYCASMKEDEKKFWSREREEKEDIDEEDGEGCSGCSLAASA
eukprot:gene2092-1272_t